MNNFYSYFKIIYPFRNHKHSSIQFQFAFSV
uniref:Uncharacterized protein n=1 Tax=Tetranychus urticae TaxID=32264 RepID=T1KGU8_TETUR